MRGATDLAGEIGHVPVHPDGEPCACGQRGCIETYASAAAIARRYLARPDGGRSADRSGGARGTTGPPQQVWDEAAQALGIALVGYTMLLDPSLVVLAGGLAAAGRRCAIRFVTLSARLAWRPAPAVELSPLAGRAGQYGAALLAWRAAGREHLGDAWRRDGLSSHAAGASR